MDWILFCNVAGVASMAGGFALLVTAVVVGLFSLFIGQIPRVDCKWFVLFYVLSFALFFIGLLPHAVIEAKKDRIKMVTTFAVEKNK